MSAAAVRRSVAGFNGHVTWAYSQGDWATVKIMATNSVSRWGICKSLSAQWVVDHAYGGALANRVVGADGKVNPTAIKKIKDDFIALWNDQATATQEWMRVRGLLRRGTSKTFTFDKIRKGLTHKGTSIERGDMGQSEENDASLPDKLTAALRAIGAREKKVRMGGSYVQISFGASDGGHAVAAWIAQDALFFDPNNGEYWFENAKDFFDWFPTFYRLAGYTSWPTRFLKRWSVEEYGLAARGMGHLTKPR